MPNETAKLAIQRAGVFFIIDGSKVLGHQPMPDLVSRHGPVRRRSGCIEGKEGRQAWMRRFQCLAECMGSGQKDYGVMGYALESNDRTV
jgi:hypothetical protein